MELDDLLVGHWSSHPFSYGVMEASQLGFLSDGWGWTSWFNVDALCVTRFRWRCPEPGVLELRSQWLVQGTPSQTAGAARFASMELAERLDEVTRHRYRIGPAVPMPGAEALTAISFEEPVEFCEQYARGPVRIRREEDPAYLAVPYPAARSKYLRHRTAVSMVRQSADGGSGSAATPKPRPRPTQHQYSCMGLSRRDGWMVAGCWVSVGRGVRRGARG